jgi:carbamate kinase
VDAVIDKDLASAKLAEEMGVDIFVIATEVEGVALHYGQPEEKFLRTLTVQDGAQYFRQGHFPPWSMDPKVEAAMQFIQKSGRRAVITSIGKKVLGVNGRGVIVLGSHPSFSHCSEDR